MVIMHTNHRGHSRASDHIQECLLGVLGYVGPFSYMAVALQNYICIISHVHLGPWVLYDKN